MRREVYLILRSGCNVYHTRHCGTVILYVHTAAGTVVTALGVAAVVEHLGKISAYFGSARSLYEYHRSADHVLTEVEYERLACMKFGDLTVIARTL